MFEQELINILKEKLGTDYSVTLNEVSKNNGITLSSVNIRDNNSTVSPNIYLYGYKANYIKGEKSLESISSEIIDKYKSSMNGVEFHVDLFDFDAVKSKIYYTLVNHHKNEEMLKTLPHIDFNDLAIIFNVFVNCDEDGISSVKITTTVMDNVYHTTVDELYELAKVNTPILMPARLDSMDNIIKEILMEENNFSQEMIDDISNNLVSCNDNFMYVLSNESGINGAAAILYQDVIKDFANSLQSDLYIIPSSIHEVILLPTGPASGDMTPETLNQMISETNIEQVPMAEILSDNVYIYSRDTDNISLAFETCV